MELETFYKFISSSGVVIPDTSNVKSELQKMFQESFKGIDLTDETPAGLMVNALTIMMSAILGINAENANQFNLNTATGMYLDGLGANFLISRLGATRTTVNVTLTGTAGTIIPAGSLAMTKTDNQSEQALFSLDYAVELDDSGYGYGTMSAEEYGPITCKANTLTVIQSRVIGWSTITNNSAGVVGRNIESDNDYRERIMAARKIGNSFTEACAARILKIDGVKSCRVLDNGDATAAVVDGVNLLGHSIFVCVDGITNNNQSDIAHAIYNTRTAGCGFTVDGETNYSVSVIDDYTKVEYKMMFCSPNPISVKVDVTVESEGYEDEIRAGITEIIESVYVGEYITTNNLYKGLSKYIPDGVNIISVVLKDSDGNVQSYIKLKGNETGTITDSDITVNVI